MVTVSVLCFVAIILIVAVVLFILRRYKVKFIGKFKIKLNKLNLGTSEAVYEDVRHPSKLSDPNLTKNIAYDFTSTQPNTTNNALSS